MPPGEGASQRQRTRAGHRPARPRAHRLPGYARARARADKAEILWLAKRYDESRELYQQILDRIGQIAPDVNAAREAKYRIAWDEFTRAIKKSELDVRAGVAVSDAQWQHVRDMCQVVLELDPDPMHRADAHLALIETYSWQHRYEDVLAAVSAFFRDYSGSRSARGKLFRQMCWARVFKAEALEHLGQTDKAIQQYRIILEWDADNPGALDSRQVVAWTKRQLGRLTAEVQP